MGEYKKENGTTRVGDFLRGLGDVGKPILKAAAGFTGQEWLNKIAEGITTSKELKEEEKQRAISYYELDLRDTQNARYNETERDNSQYSSWLSKNIHEIIALCFALPFVATWFLEGGSVPEMASEAVMLILGYLYGRSKPQQ